MKAKRLLEAETGFTYNEPSEICVTEAIEKAVESLIIEGIQDKLWALKNPKDSNSVAITNYQNEKRINYKTDPLGRLLEKGNRGKLTLGFSGGSNAFIGDYSSGNIKPKTSFHIGAALNSHLFIDSESGYRGLRVKKRLEDNSMYSDLSLRYIFLPYNKQHMDPMAF